MIKRQKKLIIICASAFVLLTVLYFAVVKPIVSAIIEDAPPELLDGEVLGVNNRILMMEQIENADIERLEVHNKKGGYTFYRGSDENLYIEGKEGTPYSLSALSSVVVASGYTLVVERVTTECEDWSEYGLAPEDDPAWYVTTTRAGVSHKIYIGNKLVTGGGYYCRYDGRDALYILDTSVEVLLGSVNDLITPILTYPVATSQITEVDDVYLIRDNELIVWIDYMTPEEIEDTASKGDFRFLEPEQYTPDLSSYTSILEVLSKFYGESVLLAGNQETSLDETMLKEEYGINIEEPDYEFHYTLSGVDNFVTFSAKDEDGYMNAYSSLFNLVARINISSAQFLDWDLLRFVDRPIFQKNINEIGSMFIESGDFSVEFKLDGEGETILVTDSEGGGPYNADDLYNFRQFYKTVLSMQLEDYTENSDIANLECYMTLRITTDAGIVTEYKFYPYSTRRSFFTINGEGEFYLLTDQVTKVISDAQKILRREPVNSDAKE
ncbi:MAG: DUF4340 domain-containing protein [Firmicutes bacterium]|nr:DUF4340 domain-containing protein [Bacillota bacterium]